jgi:hypothetical protein
MERLSDFEEDDELDFSAIVEDNMARDSIAISENTEPAQLDELIPELFLIPDTNPPCYNVK